MMDARLQLPVNAMELVPHRGTMLLLDELTEYAPDRAAGKAVIASSNPFLDSTGRLQGACFVELLAQLAAAAEGYEARMAGEAVKSGYLAGVNEFIIHRQALRGDALDLRMNKTLKMGNVTVLEGVAFLGDELLAGGILKLFIAEEDADAPLTGDAVTPYAGSSIHDAVVRNLSPLDISPENGRAAGEFRFDENFPGFDGHFPGNAILPGVVMVDMVIALCESACRHSLALTNIERAKYSGRVSPGDVVRVEVKMSEDGDIYRVEAKLTSEGGPVAGFTLRAEA